MAHCDIYIGALEIFLLTYGWETTLQSYILISNKHKTWNTRTNKLVLPPQNISIYYLHADEPWL